ncbi:hypothetical protein CONPUDRAFT_73294 [Coniophora puteana RWD-64-598 SS2]|uniref:CxC2-like cysteine cluster KDZ transposase-associated domain-containing protein n=1 Tax=Coniophora puteana (strain RWD-64-598) TaxID=741705 RepID=A0A5M3MRC7_CONPW|nr:uncharacterized protein CONPUDRAFT_73294 [Coniophora puteana RWD-64-598 SS2]EIW81617.1 hypothetical protein CONPUDRAFT_73294 [Coniophora puteana RWD-64-598 SS2]
MPRRKAKTQVSTYNLLSDDEDEDPELLKTYAREVKLSVDGRWLRAAEQARQDLPDVPMLAHDSTSNELEGSYVIEETWDTPLDAEMTLNNTDVPEIADETGPSPRECIDAPLRIWVGDKDRPGYRQEYLDEYVRSEGRGSAASFPCGCGRGKEREYRCETCGGHHMMCEECCLAAHKNLPLHVISKWNGSFLERVSLKSMGLVVRPGHEDGTVCVLRHPGHAKFVVIHTNGVHSVRVDFCNCDKKLPHRQQLLRYGWFPASVDTPQTACTDECLMQFGALMSKSKVSAQGYYEALERMTDPLGISLPSSRYREFIRTSRQYEHIRLMREAGRGNVPNGLETTGPGELAVLCPACPHPDINLPQGWKDIDIARRFLYALFLAMDANFRLKSRDRGPSPADLELHDGLAYFVKTEPYKDHLKRFDKQKDVLHYGLPILLDNSPIVPPARDHFIAVVELINALVFGVPKFHAPGHDQVCATVHSFNLMVGAGRTDGEGPERGWSRMNPAGTFTKEMTSGFRHDTLNILFTWHNLDKYYGLGKTLRSRLLVAVDLRNVQQEAFVIFSESIDSNLRDTWSRMVVAWEKDKTNKNPYLSDRKIISETQVRAKLVEREREFTLLPHETTPSACIKMGQAIEDKQRRLRADLQRMKELTADERSQFEQRRTSLRREISRLQEVQRAYMPGVETLITQKDGNSDHEPEKVILWMPSSLNAEARKICTHDIANTELELREAECHAALEKIRSLIQTKYHFQIYRNLNVRGQKKSSRARTLIDEYERKIRVVHSKYEHAHTAFLSLKGPGHSGLELKILTKADIRALNEPTMEPVTPRRRARVVEQGLGEGQRIISWIWTMKGISGTDSGRHEQEGLRVEWLKARARAQRWEEEVDLLKEEMRRVRAFLEHRAQWWDERSILDKDTAILQATERTATTNAEDSQTGATAAQASLSTSSALILSRQSFAEGVRAHALRQASQQRRLREEFTRLWEKKWSAEEAITSLSEEAHSDVEDGVEGGVEDGVEDDVEGGMEDGAEYGRDGRNGEAMVE